MASHNLGLDGEFVLCTLQGSHGDLSGQTTHFKHHTARLYHSHIIFHIAFTGTHAGFRGLVCEGLGRENSDPDLATALHFTNDRAAGRFDLSGGHPTRFQPLETVFAEGDFRTAESLTLHTTTHHLAPFTTFRHQHINIPLTATQRLLADVHAFRRFNFFFNFRYSFTLVDPDLDTDLTIGGQSFRGGKIKVCTQGL